MAVPELRYSAIASMSPEELSMREDLVAVLRPRFAVVTLGEG